MPLALSLLLALLGFAAWSDEADPKKDDAPAKKEEPPLDDPLPILRVILPPDKLAVELDRAKQGVYQQLPRTDFEERVQKAARAAREIKEPPRLVEAIYRANFESDAGEESLSGGGEWKVLSLSNSPSLLPIEPLSLALLQTRRPDNRYAIVGAIDPKNPSAMSLLVESGGEKAFYFDWSARGVREPGETRFDLQIPASPVARFELSLPPDVTPFAQPSEVLLTGPTPQGNRHLWTLACGGQSRIELLLRRADPGHPPPLIRNRNNVVQTLGNGKFQGKFDFNWEVFRGTVRDLELSLDPDLVPTEVVVNNLESWRALKGDKSRKRLLIRLREPARGGRLEVTASAPLFPDDRATWTSPGVELVGGLSRGETLELRLAPELLFADWSPGHFRLTSTKLETDRTQIFSLQSSFLTEGATHQRPQARLRTPGSDFRLEETAEWHLTPDLATLAIQYQLEATRGGLTQFAVQVPTGWELDLVETAVKEIQPHATRQGSRVVFEFPRPVVPGSKFAFTAKFVRRGKFPESVPFPEIVPEGSPQRGGSFRVRVSPAYLATLVVPPMGEQPVPVEGPEPTWDVKFTGLVPAGTVHLTPRPNLVTGTVETEVAVVDRQLQMTTQLNLRAESGLPTEFIVLTVVPLDRNGKWETIQGLNRVVGVETTPPANYVPTEKSPYVRGSGPVLYWKHVVKLERPLEAPVSLRWSYAPERPGWTDLGQAHRAVAALLGGRSPLAPALALRESEFAPPVVESRQVPLPLIGFRFQSHTVSVRSEGSMPFNFGSAELKPLFKSDPGSPNSIFSVASPWPTMTIHFSSRVSWFPNLESARLTTALDRSRLLRCHLDLSVSNRNSPWMYLEFDPETVVEAVAVNGHSPSVLRRTGPIGGVQWIQIPLPDGDKSPRVELVYTRPRAAGFLVQTVEAPLPQLVFGSPPLPQNHSFRWRLGPGFDPALKEKLTPIPGGDSVGSVYRLPEAIRDDIRDLLGTKVDPIQPSANSNGSSLEWMLHADGLDWTAWDSRGEPTILVARERGVFLVGGFVACLILMLAALRSKRSRQYNSILIQAGFFVAVMGCLLLPESFRDLGRGPLIAMFCVGVGFVLAPRKPVDPSKTIVTHRPRGSSVKVTAALLLIACPSLCAAPEVYTVYLLDGNKSVLAPPALLDKLRDLTDDSLALPGSVILSDEYRFTVNENLLEGKVKYLVHGFSDLPHSLTVPLSGVRLREVLLDGAQAFPTGTGTDRLTVEVKGVGEHRLEIAFTVPITGQGADRDVRFGIPETVHGKLDFEADLEDLSELELLNWRGKQRTKRDGNRTTLTADLGRVKGIHLHWRQEGKKPRTPPRVSELSYWDLDPASATLFTSLEYRFPQGSADRFQVAIPKELEVTRVEIRPVVAPANPPPAWVRDWRFSPDNPRDGYRRLLVDLQIPVTQPVRLNLELTPTRPLSAKPLLNFPYALDVAEPEAFAAFRTQRLEMSAVVGRQNAVDTSPAGFLADHWGKVGFGPAAAPTLAYRRTGTEPMSLRPVFNPPTSAVTGSQDLHWFLGDRRFEVRAESRWKSPGNPLTFVEWELPTQVILSEIRGDGIRAWSRFGSRVQVWMQRPSEEVKLQWIGSIARAESPSERFAFDLPNVRLEGVGPHPTSLTLQTLRGWMVTPDQVTGLNSMPGGDESPHYETRQVQYGGRFWVIAPQVDAVFQNRETVRVHEGVLTLEAKILPKVRKDRRHDFTLDVKAFGDCEATLRKLTSKGPEKLTANEKGRWALTLLENESDFEGYALNLTRPLSHQDYRLPRVKLLQGDLPMKGETELTFESDDWRLTAPPSWTGDNPWRSGSGGDDEATLAPKPPEPPVSAVAPPAAPQAVVPVRYPVISAETLLRTGILLACLTLFGLLSALRHSRTGPERVALCAAMTALGFDLPEALVGGLVVVGALAVRVTRLALR